MDTTTAGAVISDMDTATAGAVSSDVDTTVTVTAVGAMSSEPASSDESCRSLHVKKRMPRWKKKYLVAGLFSDYFKQDQ